MKKTVLALFVVFFQLIVTAQFSIQSNVLDSKNDMAIEMATIQLFGLPDSAFIQGVQTNARGEFRLTKVKAGSYLLKASSIGYKEHAQHVKVEKKDLTLKTILLSENVKLLQEIAVKGTAAQLVVKNDTLEYNAAAFKTPENAVVEDLLKKLPGVEISSDGKITVNGQEIKKIRVDGKKFFHNDTELTTKNLPADMVDKIQVMEEKSDMAKLTGFEDDETERIINLTLKPNRKKGLFGNFTGGIGRDNEKTTRYDSNVFLNAMHGESQTAITGGANNTNNIRSSRGRFNTGPSGGITETLNWGINNNTVVKRNLKIGGNASYNQSNNLSETYTNKQTFLLQSNSNDSTHATAFTDQQSANMRLEIEYKIDTLRTLIIQPGFEYSATQTWSTRDYIYYTNDAKRSWGSSQNNGKTERFGGDLQIIYSRKSVQKQGRSFTSSLNTSFSELSSHSFNIARKITNLASTLIDQFTNNSNERYNLRYRFSYVEPLWNTKNLLETSISLRASLNGSEKYQYNKDDAGNYTENDSIYSNTFSNQFYSEMLELNYRLSEKKYNLTIGFKAEPSQSYSDRVYANGAVKSQSNKVINYAPNARFQYVFDKKEYFRFDYRAHTEQPTIAQMQPVRNNSNLMYETIGNPTLKPAFNQNIRMMYSKFNDTKFSSFSTWLSGTLTKDDLVTNSIFDDTNKQYSQTVNTIETPFRLNSNVMYNTPLIKKRLHLNSSTSGGYQTNYSYTSRSGNNEVIDVENLILGDLSKTIRITADQQLSLTFTHDVAEVGTKGLFRFSNTGNNLTAKNSNTYDWTLNGNIVFRLPYSIGLSSDINYSIRKGYGTFDLNQTIWNASMEMSLFKAKGLVAIKWYDILKQQLNIRQIVSDNSISYNKYNTLTSYFLLSFSYKLNQFGNSDKQLVVPSEERKRRERNNVPDYRSGSRERISNQGGGFEHSF